MKASDRYLKIVEWSEEDGCYVGHCPGLFLGGCHGDNEETVYHRLRSLVEEWVETMEREGTPLPPATAGKRYSGKLMLRVRPDLHQALAIRATREGLSLNNYIARILERAA